MAKRASAPVSVQVAIEQPPERIVPALQAVLADLERRPGSMNLSVNLATDLEAPVEMSLTVPVALHAARGSGNEFALRIEAMQKRHFYPSFRGMLRVIPAHTHSSVIDLGGTYGIPLGRLGRTLDATLLRGSAQSSLKRFLADLVGDASMRVAV